LTTAVRAYDTVFCDAVSSHWAQLLKRTPVPQDNGEVVLQFNLHADGQLSGLVLAKNTERLNYGLLCQRAVTDPAPYAPWPTELRKQFGKTRPFEVTFLFDLDGNGFLAYIEDPKLRTPTSGKGEATRIVFYLPDKHRMTEASEHPWGNQMPSRKVLETNRDRRNKGADLFVPTAPYWGGVPYNWGWDQAARDLGKMPAPKLPQLPAGFGR
jgi:hypothetical protein